MKSHQNNGYRTHVCKSSDKERAYYKKYYERNKHRLKAQRKLYHKNHEEEVNTKRKGYYQRYRWRIRDREKVSGLIKRLVRIPARTIVGYNIGSIVFKDNSLYVPIQDSDADLPSATLDFEQALTKLIRRSVSLSDIVELNFGYENDSVIISPKNKVDLRKGLIILKALEETLV